MKLVRALLPLVVALVLSLPMFGLIWLINHL
jgi:hypothetical protein